jgi:hypothetical protein
MKRMMVRYKVKPDRVAENERSIADVFEQLNREQPAGLRYASFKLDDGVSFMHIVEVDTTDGSHPLQALSAFNAFTASVRDRCDEPPVSVELQAVGAYHLFGV